MAMAVGRNVARTFLAKAKLTMAKGSGVFQQCEAFLYNASSYSTYAAQHVFDAGQPTPETHPQLLAAEEITPGITGPEFIARRKRLLELLPEKSLVIMASALVKMMTDVVPYPFRQDADYLYFTGCQQPGGIAVLNNDFGLCMFMPDSDPEEEMWQGQVAGTYAALNIFKADQTFSISRIDEFLSTMIRKASKIYHNERVANSHYTDLPAFKRALHELKVHNLCQYTHEARWIKSPSEIKIMRQSASITCQALLQTMLVSRASPYENILAATVEYECKIRGAQRMAFTPVVGGGANATIIHYSRNDQQIKGGEMVLMDVGCEVHGYVSDLTRTWPPCGNFSLAQVITIEPGVYIPVKSSVPERFRGIGIRIEDEVLITDTGHEVLTASVPREIKQIESLLQQGWAHLPPVASKQ